MTRPEKQYFGRLLQAHREEALQLLCRIDEQTRGLDVDCPMDTGDLSTTSLGKEALFQLSSQKRRLLRLIDSALQRVNDGSFGICAVCGDEIGQRRLEAVPWTQRCLHCQEEAEARSKLESQLTLSSA
jgi:DnaK suppressor protein